MEIRKLREDDIDQWAGLRSDLWPDHRYEDLVADSTCFLTSEDMVCFVLEHPERGLAGFIEAALYPVPDRPYVHIEGWYVKPEFRGMGYGKRLVSHIKEWSIHRGIEVLTSDTTPDYPLSPAAHTRSGFRVLAEMTIFLKELESHQA